MVDGHQLVVRAMDEKERARRMCRDHTRGRDLREIEPQNDPRHEDHSRIEPTRKVRVLRRGLADDRLVDSLVVAAFHAHGNRQPPSAVRGLNPVAVAPVAARELPVVVEDELVDAVDEVEVALPRDVAGLDDRDRLCHLAKVR